MPLSPRARFIGRVVILLAGTAAVVAVSTITASWQATRQLMQIVGRAASDASAPSVPQAVTDEVDFFHATGIEIAQLRNFLADVATNDHLNTFPLHLSFWNDQGECLIDQPVAIEWRGGRDRISVGSSGVLRIMLRPELLDGLRFQVAQGYRFVTQQTIPIGKAYKPYSTASGAARRAVSDYELEMRIWRQLAGQQARGIGLGANDARNQLQRRSCDWRPPRLEAAQLLDASEIYRSRRDSVVIVGHLLPDGNVVYAAGVVVDPAGVIATAYHVVDKPQAVARCITTADGRSFPIVEIIAADRAHDVALVRMEAEGLVASAISPSDDVGAPLTIVSHPGGEFFSVTEGCLRRYQMAVLYGVEVEQMAVTADFSDGASGGPIFNRRGEVAGIVSFRRHTADSEPVKMASPAAALRLLFD